ncbi:MAG: hypothetical protein H0V44_05880 [Planctomycetes bacterium]|nr:hypothetical protein [Planctomycetota bacterium]
MTSDHRSTSAVCIVITQRDGGTIRHVVRYDGDPIALQTTWRRLLKQALRVQLWDASGTYLTCACNSVAEVVVVPADLATAPRPPGAFATWFYPGTIPQTPKDITTSNPVLPPE